MHIPSYARSKEVGFNMTPMIDVVFLLIIFFLVSSHLAKQESQMDIDLPNAESGLESEASTNPRIVINVTNSGQLLISGRRITAAEVEDRLIEHVENNGPNIEVRIRSDRQIPFAQVRPVMLACAKMGIWDVAFSVYPADGER
tara:strand:- start:44 stop:472 length:429 start_codon:yes stop_codon:yes gene_type:complete